MGALGLAVLLVLAACSIGGSSGKKSNATATTSTTINLEASPTTSPVGAGSPAASPIAATPATSVQTGASPATPGTSTNGVGATTPATAPTKAAATKAARSNEPPVVTTCSPKSIPPFTGKKANYKVSVDGLNFRAGPGTDCDTLGDPLAVDTPVKVISDPVVRKGEKDKWVEIEVNGQDGWVAEQFIKPAS